MTDKPNMPKAEHKNADTHLASSADPLATDWKYEGGRLINLTWFGLFHCIRYRAQNNIPDQGPMIIAPNHVSYYDPPVIAAGIRSRVRFMAWDALFRVPILRGIMLSYGAYPVKVKSADKGAVVQTLKILRNREAVMIFPEGGRSPDGQLLPFEQGLARLADQTDAAIVPVTILGALEAWPSSRALPRPFHPINIKYHAPVYPADLPEGLSPKERATELNRRVAAPIARRIRAWNKMKQKHRR